LGAALQASGFCKRVLTKPVIATITVATPARDSDVIIPAARRISVGLYPSRIQADGFSIEIDEGGTNCMGWVDWLGLAGEVFMF